MKGVAYVSDAGDAAGAIVDGALVGAVALRAKVGVGVEGDGVARRQLDDAVGGQFVRGAVLQVVVSRVGWKGESRAVGSGQYSHRDGSGPWEPGGGRPPTRQPPTWSASILVQQQQEADGMVPLKM